MNAFITLNKSSLLLDEPVYSSERGNFKTNLIHITFPRANLFEIEY